MYYLGGSTFARQRNSKVASQSAEQSPDKLGGIFPLKIMVLELDPRTRQNGATVVGLLYHMLGIHGSNMVC